MPLKRYKLIGTTMMERNKGEWVRWNDVKDRLTPDHIPWPKTKMTDEMKADNVLKGEAIMEDRK